VALPLKQNKIKVHSSVHMCVCVCVCARARACVCVWWYAQI